MPDEKAGTPETRRCRKEADIHGEGGARYAPLAVGGAVECASTPSEEERF